MWASFVDVLGDGSRLLSEGCMKGITDRDQAPLDMLVELDPFDVIPPELDLLDEVTKSSCIIMCLITVHVQ